MRLKRFLPVCLTMLLSLTALQAQNNRTTRAYETFDAGEYFAAIDQLKDAYQRTTDQQEKLNIAYYIAESYRLTSSPAQAELWYSKVIARDYQNPLSILYYADALKMNGKYEEAKAQYQRYRDLQPSDPRGSDGILSCQYAIQWMEQSAGYQVEEMKFLNSRNEDFSPAFSSNDYQEIYFTSSRDETTGNVEHGATGQGFSDIFFSSMDKKGKWSTPLPLSPTVNTESEEGTPSFTADYGTMFFTRCNMNKRKTEGCQIFEATREGTRWTDIKPIPVASDSLVVAHPAVSADGLTLYFISDMDGSTKTAEGKNSKDIWVITRTSLNTEWGNPQNAGSIINTAGDELFPYLHNDGTLYFSSNGHIGMGGLDIFKAVKNADGQWTVENMKYPVNSPSDDFGIVFEQERESGYFSSSRKGRTSSDIYSFVLPPLRFTIAGIVRDEKNDNIIADAIVKSIGSDGVTLETKTGSDGIFRFNLNPGTDYVFIAEKAGYLKGKERESTKGVSQNTEFRTEIFLASTESPIEVENIFFDLDKADLRPESMVSLDRLVETLNDNPNVVIELGSHTDARASDAYNLDLSRRRAESVVNYLIEKGIARDRLVARGYGETVPKTVDKKDHDAYSFLEIGAVLNETLINGLGDEDRQEMAHFLNRRTEFKVLRTDYGSE